MNGAAMGSRPWYKRFPSNFISGTLKLTFEQKGAYSIVLDLIYDEGGPIPENDRWISGVLGLSPRKWRTIKMELVAAGKLYLQDGYIGNKQADKHLENDAKRLEKLVENGRKGGEKKRDNLQKASKTGGDALASATANIVAYERDSEPEPEPEPEPEKKDSPPDPPRGAQPDLLNGHGGQDDGLDIPTFLKRKPDKPVFHAWMWDEFRGAFPRRSVPQPWAKGEKVFRKLIERGVDFNLLQVGAVRYRQAMEAESQIGTPYVKQVTTWLNQECWKDYPPIDEPEPEARYAN